eukprot:COSAG03_NODE_1470_length_4024_cov_7.581146_2_plen_136_part_00
MDVSAGFGRPAKLRGEPTAAYSAGEPQLVEAALDSGGTRPPELPPIPPELQQRLLLQQQQQQKQEQTGGGGKGKAATGSVDFTEIPKLLDAQVTLSVSLCLSLSLSLSGNTSHWQFAALDEDSALRPTLIRTGDV